VSSGEITGKVRILYDFRLQNPDTGVFSSTRTEACMLDGECPITYTGDFMKRSELEASYLQDDRIVIVCDLTVVLGATVTESRIIYEVQVPPSDALDSFGKFLESAEGGRCDIQGSR
jgi:speckle-type POZ protein